MGANVSWAQSQPPAPSAPKPESQGETEAKNNQQAPPGDQRGTEQAPFVIKIIGTEPKSENGTAQNTKPSERNSTDWWMFGATVGIGFIGLLQLVAFVAQAIYLRKADANAQRHERAYIFGGGPQRGGDYPEWVYGAIENDGRTPGFLKQVEWGLCEEEKFPKHITVSKIIDNKVVPFNTVDGAEDVWPSTEKGLLYHRIKFEPKSNNGKIFFGRFVYEDIFRIRRYSTFKLKLNEKTGSDPLPGCYSDWS
jgi:hypothetical protein